MSTRSLPFDVPPPQPGRPALEIVRRKSVAASDAVVRALFWSIGLALAVSEAWIFRYQVSADSISYLDMSDAMMPGGSWHRLINGVWSPLYPLLLGLFRRVINISAPNEIVAGHLLNIAFFLFAFLCFEFLLRTAIARGVGNKAPVVNGAAPGIPRWANLSLGYSLFLWASIAEISVRNLRADMLMSGFVYLALGILLRMNGRPARWNDYVLLGLVLGVGVLAKEPLLPLGLLILVLSLLAVEDWRAARKMAVVALAIFLSIGSLYFVPLSLARGQFTFGESSTFNYLIYINRAGPSWYLQNTGSARGSFTHPPQKIFSSPLAYSFPISSLVTHPLRFDPSYWIDGVRPRFVLKRQIIACIPGIRNMAQILVQLGMVILAAVALAWRQGKPHRLIGSWPLWAVGLAGCLLYIPVHVEPRYVAAFLALFWLGIVMGFGDSLSIAPKAIGASAVLVLGSLLIPMAARTYVRYAQYARNPNADAEAAAELASLGIKPGDKVARISPKVIDLGIERIERVEVTAEVDFQHASEFWSAPVATQSELLRLFAAHGVRAVIATLPKGMPPVNSGWRHLGSTQYWAWLPAGASTP